MRNEMLARMHQVFFDHGIVVSKIEDACQMGRGRIAKVFNEDKPMTVDTLTRMLAYLSTGTGPERAAAQMVAQIVGDYAVVNVAPKPNPDMADGSIVDDTQRLADCTAELAGQIGTHTYRSLNRIIHKVGFALLALQAERDRLHKTSLRRVA